MATAPFISSTHETFHQLPCSNVSFVSTFGASSALLLLCLRFLLLKQGYSTTDYNIVLFILLTLVFLLLTPAFLYELYHILTFCLPYSSYRN